MEPEYSGSSSQRPRGIAPARPLDSWEQFMHEEAGHIVETPVEARAGFLDRPTLVVLIVSTSLMIGVFAVLYIGFFAR